jgi:excisionase family DNA binding protein
MNMFDSAKNLRLLWTCREAAAALSISERTLWSLTKSGDMPCVRIGRSVRYDPEDIRSWIDAQKA